MSNNSTIENTMALLLLTIQTDNRGMSSKQSDLSSFIYLENKVELFSSAVRIDEP